MHSFITLDEPFRKFFSMPFNWDRECSKLQVLTNRLEFSSTLKFPNSWPNWGKRVLFLSKNSLAITVLAILLSSGSMTPFPSKSNLLDSFRSSWLTHPSPSFNTRHTIQLEIYMLAYLWVACVTHYVVCGMWDRCGFYSPHELSSSFARGEIIDFRI